MHLIRFDKVKEITYNKNEKRFITWLRLINANDYEELEQYGKDDEIMDEVREFVRRWNEESNKGGFERYIAEQREEAAEKAERKSIIKTAKNMLFKDIPINTIIEVTGLSEKELNKLKKTS